MAKKIAFKSTYCKKSAQGGDAYGEGLACLLRLIQAYFSSEQFTIYVQLICIVNNHSVDFKGGIK